MSNNWFRFKKFMVRQDMSAMKVGTDGVLLGAWSDISGCAKILDIGTGTGLIALMIAQRCEAFIETIEIDAAAAQQASENVASSEWASRIRIRNISFQDYSAIAQPQYDHIVCNPPFFINSLKAKGEGRNMARHSDHLELKELVSGVVKILNVQGRFSVILPSDKEQEMLKLSEDHQLFPSRIMRVRPLPEKDFKRVLMEFSFIRREASVSEMSIETTARHQYSQKFLDLTADYYLDAL